ncbi:MAG TPA: hypothetical protein VL500_04655 [Candidatus Eisenbacteria bacterium]|jgi:hypothetical protein|nr:hypothetical protein [Candidatus Eisenbacteria bacterium]
MHRRDKGGHCILRSMNAKERRLYHQIHPAKLAADTGSGIAAVILLANGQAVIGLALAIVVPVAATFALLRYADLEPQKRSRLGAYVKKYMTPAAQIQRLAGFAILCGAAWKGSYLLGVLGAALIVHAWTMGLLIPKDLR